MQRESNMKVLSQIKFNVSFLNEVIQKLVTSLYYDKDVIQLMTARESSDPIDMLSKRARIDKFADYTSFLHSIIIYNANGDRFIWGGDPVLQDSNAPIYDDLRQLIKGNEKLPKLTMIPMSLNKDAGHVDLFSIFNYESTDYQKGQSVFILNIRPQWLFDNIKLINRLAWEGNESVSIIDKEGKILTSQAGLTPVSDEFMTALTSHRSNSADYGYFYYTDNNQKKIVNYLNTGINGWTLFSTQPYETLAQKADSLKKTSIILTLIALLLSLMATLAISLRLYRPLGKLVSSFRDESNEAANEDLMHGDEFSYVSDVYQQTVSHLKSIRNEQVTTRSIVRSYYVRQMVTESASLSESKVKEWIEQHNLDISPSGPYYLCVIRIDDFNRGHAYTEDKDSKLLHFAIVNIAHEILSQSYQCEAVEMRSDHLVAIISRRTGGQWGEQLVQGAMVAVQEVIARLYRITFSAALSEEIASHQGLVAEYRRSLQNVHYSLAFGKQSLITPAMVQSNEGNIAAVLPGELEKKLTESIKGNRSELFHKSLDKIFRYIAGLHHDYMVYMVLHVYILMKNIIKEKNEHRIVPISLELADINERLLTAGSLGNMKQILIRLYEEMNENGKRTDQEKNNVLIDTIKDIIEQNYGDLNLNLQMIGELMRLSPDYIGKLFKRHQNMSVGEYINDVRLRQVVLYLEQGDCTINELIEKIGFGTRSNFFRLFKNKYGTTPKEYRIKRNLTE
ncbi:AraC family transcriptional regulator [Paenibacillus tarimensis]